MDPEEYISIARQEGSHWWYAGMRRITASLLNRVEQKQAAWRILDAGCGSGGTSRFLRRWGTVVGLDVAPQALQLAREGGGLKLVLGSIEALPFADGRFDLVTAFDVLYHRAVHQDGQALRELTRVLRPGGWLLLRVPAFEFLRGGHDMVVHTQRRYRASLLRAKTAELPLRLEVLTYANSLLFPLALTLRLLERLKPGPPRSEIRPVPRPLSRLLEGILGLEALWLGRGSLPFGVSLYCLAQKHGS